MLSWEKASERSLEEEKYQVRLSKRDASRLEALAGLYPGMKKTEVISQLLVAALDEVERQMPYKPGNKVVALDEMGDPLYEDVGLTPRYQRLRQQHFHATNDVKNG